MELVSDNVIVIVVYCFAASEFIPSLARITVETRLLLLKHTAPESE